MPLRALSRSTKKQRNNKTAPLGAHTRLCKLLSYQAIINGGMEKNHIKFIKEADPKIVKVLGQPF